MLFRVVFVLKDFHCIIFAFGFSFFGNRKCANSNIQRLDVVTSFKANGNPVKKYTEQNRHLKCCDWHTFISDCSTNIKYDLGVVVSFGHLIPAHIINMFPLYVRILHSPLYSRNLFCDFLIFAILSVG